MTFLFLSILAALIAERFLVPYQSLRRPVWFAHWLDWHQSLPFAGGLREGISGLVVLLLPPLLLVNLAQWMLGGWTTGIPGWLFSTLVLLYSLGPEELGDQVTRLARACKAGDSAQTRIVAGQLADNAPEPDAPGFASRMAEAVLEQAQTRLFAVLFWFLLVGPIGALAYRLSQETVRLSATQTRTGLEPAARRLAWLLDWLPARMLAALFALAGCFEPALQGWRGCVPEQYRDPGKALAVCTGAGALQLGSIVLAEEPAAGLDGSLAKSALGLVQRSLVLLVTLLGLVTAAGWIG